MIHHWGFFAQKMACFSVKYPYGKQEKPAPEDRIDRE